MNGSLSLSQRPSLAEDAEFLFRVYAATRAEEMAILGWPAAQQEMFLRMQFRVRRQSYAAAYADASAAILLAGEQPAGAATVWRGPGELRLVDIALLPEYRNRGFGAEWISRLIEEADAAALPLRLSVLRGNPAIRLYRRLGFVATADGSMYIEMEHKHAAVNQPELP